MTSSIPHLLAQTSSRPFFDPSWVTGHWDDIREAATQHLLLTGASVAAGIVISLVLATLAVRHRKLYAPIAGFGGVLYTIPSLAAFALLWPLLGGLRNRWPIAVIALTSYTILILVRNIVTGIDSVPEDVKEAADGMGYRPARRFLTIELPLALPSIVAGIRIATVTIVGLVTVTALIGLGGFGALILDGIRRSIPFPTEVIVGIAGSVVLATVIDFALLRVERLLTPWAQKAGS